MLLPPSLAELKAFPNALVELFFLLWQGAYPKIYDRNIPARQWLADYIETYIQRDMPQVINVGDLQVFAGFLKLFTSYKAAMTLISVSTGCALAMMPNDWSGASLNVGLQWCRGIRAARVGAVVVCGLNQENLFGSD